MNHPLVERAWDKFREGAELSDTELVRLILEAEAGLRYLENRGQMFFLAAKIREDLDILRGYASERSLRVSEETGLFPIDKRLLSGEDGFACEYTFSGTIQGLGIAFADKYKGKRYSSCAWNKLFQEFVFNRAVKALVEKV